MSIHRQFFPDEEDEKGAAKALMRLQDTYQLDSEAFSKGKLPGNQRENMSTQEDRVSVYISARKTGRLTEPTYNKPFILMVCLFDINTIVCISSLGFGPPDMEHFCEMR